MCFVLATNLPTTLYSARKFLGIDRDNFQCTKLYQMDEIVVNNGRQSFARTCDNLPFPRAKRPKPCGAQLAQKIILKNGSVKFYAYKTYCYKSIIDSLETLLKRPGLEEQCEKRKSRKIDHDL